MEYSNEVIIGVTVMKVTIIGVTIMDTCLGQ